MVMHTPPENLDAAVRDRIRRDWSIFLGGWVAAEEHKPCNPPASYSKAHRALFTRAYHTKRNEMISVVDLVEAR